MSRISFNNLQEYSKQIQALVENEIAEAKIKVIKIPATQALSQNPPQVWLTDDQYDQMFSSYEFVLDGSEIGFGFTKWYKSYDSTNEWFYSSMVAPGSFNYYLSFDYDDTNNRYIVTVNTQASTNNLTANTCFTLDATAFASLVSTHTATVASPVFTGLSNAYEFVTIKASINSTNYNVKLCRNDTNKYSGLFFIEDSSHLYELTLYYNGTNVYLRCATVY